MFIILFHFLTAEWQQHSETKEIAILQERHSESRRLRHQENEADELSTHLLAPPCKAHKDERPSSDGDDEQEGEESEIVSNNPFALLSDEWGRNSISGSPMSTVEKPGERNISCRKNVLLFRESNHQKRLSSAPVVMLHVLAEFMALKRTISWTWMPIGKTLLSIDPSLCRPIPQKHLRGQTIHMFIGFPLKCPCENCWRLILTNKTARER